MDRKFGWGGCAPFLGRGAGSPSSTNLPGPRPSSIPGNILIHAAIWPQQIWAENWGALPIWRRGRARSPSNTMSPVPRPTCMASFILIRPTIWLQCTNVTDRQARQTDNGLIAKGELFYKLSPKNGPKVGEGAHPSPQPKRNDRFSRFCRAHRSLLLQTDRPHYSVCNDSPHLRT